MIKVLLFMFLCHIIDDFVLQPKSLGYLKQKDNWRTLKNFYKYDYLMALFIHSLSWSIMIHIPLICMDADNSLLYWSIPINLITHGIIDDLKANRGKINLIMDQTIHFCQIVITFLIFFNI
jgi:hypothetical protein